MASQPLNTAKGPFTGVGVGLRRPHLEEVARLETSPVPFWEIAPENVVGQGGAKARQAWTILERDPVISHGLSMSMGGFDPWADEVLDDLVAFLKRTGTPWHSEHLCWTSVGGSTTHELLPMPFTAEAVAHTVDRVKRMQDRLPVPFLLENISWYAELGEPEMSEHDFLAEVLERGDCGWLLDINNIYVNSRNHGFDPKAFIEGLPLHRVKQMHIAGHAWDEEDQLIIDTHGAPVIDPVIELFTWVLPKIFEATGEAVPVLLERDNHVPPLAELLAERTKLQAAYDAALAPFMAETRP
ncbi:MAG TPA: DUF692 domain-containing protein [Holophagaceae bacterium]|nr:DUF692 domain-containing protein [Holophagaceae bacterium]